MRKRGLVFVLILILVLSVNVLALEKTRIHGNVIPGSGVTLKLSYYANGVAYTDQLVQKTADTWGNWEHKMSSDAGAIGLTVISGGFEKTFEIPSGTDFEVKLGDDTSTEQAEVTEEVNNTPTEEVEVEIAVDENSEPEKKSSFLSGFNIFEEGNSTSADFKVFLVFIGLFITVVIANLVSHGIMNLAGKRGERSISGPVNVVKLSDRLKEQREGREKEEQEIKKQREYIEWQNKKKVKEEKIKQLQEKLDELEKE